MSRPNRSTRTTTQIVDALGHGTGIGTNEVFIRYRFNDDLQKPAFRYLTSKHQQFIYTAYRSMWRDTARITKAFRTYNHSTSTFSAAVLDQTILYMELLHRRRIYPPDQWQRVTDGNRNPHISDAVVAWERVARLPPLAIGGPAGNLTRPDTESRPPALVEPPPAPVPRQPAPTMPSSSQSRAQSLERTSERQPAHYPASRSSSPSQPQGYYASPQINPPSQAGSTYQQVTGYDTMPSSGYGSVQSAGNTHQQGTGYNTMPSSRYGSTQSTGNTHQQGTGYNTMPSSGYGYAQSAGNTYQQRTGYSTMPPQGYGYAQSAYPPLMQTNPPSQEGSTYELGTGYSTMPPQGYGSAQSAYPPQVQTNPPSRAGSPFDIGLRPAPAEEVSKKPAPGKGWDIYTPMPGGPLLERWNYGQKSTTSSQAPRTRRSNIPTTVSSPSDSRSDSPRDPDPSGDHRRRSPVRSGGQKKGGRKEKKK